MKYYKSNGNYIDDNIVAEIKKDAIDETIEMILMAFDKGKRMEMSKLNVNSPKDRISILEVNHIYNSFSKNVKQVQELLKGMYPDGQEKM